MGYVIEITESKVEKMSVYVEDMLWAGGELMHCLEKIKEESSMGERGGSYGNRGGQGSNYGSRSMGSRGSRNNYGSRSNYGSRGDMGYRDEEEWDDDDMMQERRGVRGSGRSRRY